MNEIQGMISDVIDDCHSSVKEIKHKVGELSTKPNLIIQVVGNQLVLAPRGIELQELRHLSLGIIGEHTMLRSSQTSSLT